MTGTRHRSYRVRTRLYWSADGLNNDIVFRQLPDLTTRVCEKVVEKCGRIPRLVLFLLQWREKERRGGVWSIGDALGEEMAKEGLGRPEIDV